jgi:hypothetical protein
VFVQFLPGLITLFGTVALLTAGIILLAGFLPMDMSKGDGASIAMTLLVCATGMAIAVCAVSLIVWCIDSLPVSWAIVAAGLGLLTGPLAFQILPNPLRNQPMGLICTMGVSLITGFLLHGTIPV